MATPKSWCDKLASVPTAGLKLQPHFASSDSIVDSLSPILNEQMRGERITFNVTQQSTFDLQFQTDQGFHYSVDPAKCVVSFRHRLRTKPMSAGPPIMEMLSHPLPYTLLLAEVCERLADAASRLPDANNRLMQRVGLLSITTVAMDEAPPGIIRFLEYAGRPWRSSLEHFDISIMSSLGKEKDWKDRCIHTLKKDEDPESLLTIQLDWQRVFDAGRPITTDILRPLLTNCREAALSYFEDMAEGSRFDEQLISETTGV